MKHPYFEGLHNEEAEPECEEPFDWTWDDFEPTKELLQQMVYEESMEFHHGEEDDEIAWFIQRRKLQYYTSNFIIYFLFDTLLVNISLFNLLL